MKKTTVFLSSILIFLTSWIYTGIYVDDENGDINFFIKHKPSLQFYFKIKGEAFDHYDSLPSKEKEKVDAYNTFVTNRLFSMYLPMPFE